MQLWNSQLSQVKLKGYEKLRDKIVALFFYQQIHCDRKTFLPKPTGALQPLFFWLVSEKAPKYSSYVFRQSRLSYLCYFIMEFTYYACVNIVCFVLLQWSVENHANNRYFYDTCSGFSASSLPDNYIITPVIVITPAKRVKVKVGYKIKKCARMKETDPKDFCKEYIEVYVSKAPVRNGPYVRSYSTTLNNTSSNSSEVWVDMENKDFLKISFRDQGSCVTVENLTVSYLTCTVKAENLIKFVETPAPASGSITVTGKCEPNSLPDPPAAALTMVCFANGTTPTSGKCICNEGYEMKMASCKGEYAFYFL